MMQRTQFVAGNWKLHGSLATNRSLLAALKDALADVSCDTAVCVPYPYLFQMQEELSASHIAWGAQDVSEQANGAYTGEVSSAMLSDFGCRYAIVGHSERRSLYGDTDDLVGLKAKAALLGKLTPIICIGETLEEREQGGIDEVRRVLTRQLDAALMHCGAKGLQDSVIAYEPVWAIGTGKTASPEQAQEAHALIRSHLEVADKDMAQQIRILYGGSVKPANASELFAQPDIDGGLIGGASLNAEDFSAICHAHP